MATNSDKTNPSSSIDEVLNANTHQQTRLLKRTVLVVVVFTILVITLGVAWSFFSDKQFDGQADNTQPLPLDAPTSPQEQEAARQQFMQEIANYEQSIAPLLLNEQLAKFDSANVQRARELQKQALSSFANGRFLEGATTLNTSSEVIKEVEAAWLAKVNGRLSDAKQFFENGQIDRARLNLNEALQLDPFNQDGLAQQDRIEAFLPVQEAISALNIAKIENDIDKQIRWLQEIINLDPKRSVYQLELTKLLKIKKESEIATLVSRAFSALQNHNYVLASEYLSELQRLEPRHASIGEISSQLGTYHREKEKAKVLNMVRSLFEQQQFSETIAQGQLALATFPTNLELQRLVSDAQKIKNIEQSLDIFISKPERLQDARIRAAAKDSLTKAISAITQSNKVSDKVRQLSDLLTAASTLVPVTIVSDRQTDISVLGVGNVGKTSRKTIELAPGEYVFEGRRTGFKSKQVRIRVMADQAINITVVCDEKI